MSWSLKRCFICLTAIMLLLVSVVTEGLAQTWSSTATMSTPRSGLTGTLLPAGQVVVAGGYGNGGAGSASIESYDPNAATFTVTGSMVTPRLFHTGTWLPTGKILLAGGCMTSDCATGALSSAELYDPSTGVSIPTGSMVTTRYQHIAVLLPNGKVLVAGGEQAGGAVASAELYDPTSGTFSPTGSMGTARNALRATLLSTGKVLITGGTDNSGTAFSTAELYDPATGLFTATGSMSTGRNGHTATLLSNGTVLVAGGCTPFNCQNPTATTELYDPATGLFTSTGSMTSGRATANGVLLSTGQVLIAGGSSTNFSYVSSAELYDPNAHTFTPTGSMIENGRLYASIALLPNSKVLIAGGGNSNGQLATAELYTPALPPVAKVSPDQTVTGGTLVTLDGSGSYDLNNQPLTYSWTQVAGPTVALNGANTAIATFIAPQPPLGGVTLTFQLTVNDGTQSSIPVTSNVTVKYVNHAPVANAGLNQTVGAGGLVTLDGSASYDPDGDTLTYQWSQTGGPTATLSNPTAVKPTFIAPPVSSGSATLTFQLTVSDGSLSSSAVVTITDEHVNHPPVANAGPNQTVNDTKLVTLDGSASSDLDNDPLTYAWVQQSGTPVTLSNPAAIKPTFTAPLVSSSGDTLVFQLTVTDPYLLSSSATTQVTVVHQNPVCTAAQPSQPVLWPPNHKLVPVQIVGVTDPDNLTTTITITAVTQDEPVNGLGDGDTSPDAAIQGQGVLLRAERSGTGSGRIYQVAFTATDTKGGTCNGTVTVSVPLYKAGTAIDNGQRYNSLLP